MNMRRFSLLLLLGTAMWAPHPASAATVLFCPMDSLEGWSVRSVGPAQVGIVRPADNELPCAEVSADRATAMFSRELPLDEVRGARLEVSCLVETAEITGGPQVSQAAKMHLAMATPQGIRHHSARLLEASDWHREAFSLDVPEDAARVVLNLGLEACSGRARFRQLIVRSDRRGVYPLNLSSATNAGHEQLGIGAFPEKTVEWEGIPFAVLDAGTNNGQDCLRLKGIGHEDWPPHTSAPIRVGRIATAVYILHASLKGQEKSETPCVLWTAEFAGGPSSGFSVFEGRQIGPVRVREEGRAEDLDNWKIAWQGEDPEGPAITFGVTKWDIYSDAPIERLTCRAYHGAPPVVLAVTAVEELPQPEPEGGPQEFDEFGEPIGDY